MSSIPAVELFTTSILSNHKVRHRHERYLAVFAAKRIDYVYHDLASDEEAKKRFRRKALDQQIPNVLVHNEWRGTFEEFEEAVEFGELGLFLRIDPSRVVAAAAAAPASESSATATTADEAPPEKPASSGATAKLPPAPTAMPKMAPQGSGAGPKRNSMDDFLDSLDAWKPQMESMSEADLSALLDEGESSKARQAHAAAPKAPRDARAYPGHRAPQEAPQIKRTYFPTEAAGTRPLRLPKMGDGTARAASSPVLQSSPSFNNNNSGDSSAPTSPRSPGAAASGHTRFSVSQNSSRALAAEASASASHRTFSARQLRSGLDSGRMLQDVMGELRESSSSAARSSRLGGAGGEADALLEELGLADLKLTDEEAEAFLLNGAVPDGLELGGSRTRRGTAATKAREQEAARDVADKARSLAEERRASASVAKVRKEREREESERGQAAAPAPPPADMSSKTRELLERAKEKRASRQIGLAQGQQGLEGAAKLESLLPAAVVGEKAEKAEQEAPSPAPAEEQKTEEQLMTTPSEGKLQEDVAKAKETDDAIVQAGDDGKFATASSAPEDGAPLAPTSVDDPSAEPASSTTEAAAPTESTPSADQPSSTPPATSTSPATSTPPKDNVEPPVAADTEADATPKVRQSVLPAFTAAAATPAPTAATPTTTSSGDDEEIDDLFARLSGLGENQRFSSVLAPAPAATSQGLGSTKEVALAEEDESEAQNKEEAPTSPNGKTVTDAATTPASPPAAPTAAAGTLTPSASSNVGPTSSSSLSPTSGKGSTDNSMSRSLSTSSSASSSAGAGNAPPSASSSSTRRSNAGSSPAPSTPGSRRGMDLTRKPSNINIGGLTVASPTRSSSVSTSGSGSGHSPASPPPEGYYGSIPAAAVPMSPKSPTLKARLKSFGSLGGRKSTSSNASGGGRGATPASPPASASKMSVSSNGGAGGHDADWRSQRTLSQILRDADAAMADDDEDGDGVGALSGAADGDEEEEEDDGLGSAEIKI